MKYPRFLLVLLTLTLLGGAGAAVAQTATNANEAAFNDLIKQVRADIKADKTSEADLAGDLKKFDELLAAENGKKTDLAGQILYMKAMLYSQILKDDDKANPIYAKILSEYPDTKAAKMAQRVMAKQKAQAGLAVGKPFPDFDEKDVDGKPLSVAMNKGKVVMVDFWATWCGPCRGEMPNVIATYAKYHDQGFEIIGVSLDEDKDKVLNFTKENKMPWPQYFDGQGWQNKLASKYGVDAIPADFLIDGQGKIIGRDLRGEELSKAVATALGK